MRFRIGLLAKTVLLLLVIFAGGLAAVHLLTVPSMEREVRGQLAEVAGECLATGRQLMEARADHLAVKARRELHDLPFELTAGDAEKTRKLVTDYAEGRREVGLANLDLLTAEFMERMSDRTEEQARDLAADFRRTAFTGLLSLLAVVLVLNGAALARTVLWPLSLLLRATEKVAGGDLEERVGMRSGDEVGRLGRAFDRMTESLGASRAEIEALNRSLADQVREKTRALVHSEKMASIGTLAGGVAHEFNNLLGGIIGCAENARAEDDAEEVRESLAMILRTARRACNITENLLRFSRPPERIYRETDLSALVREALELIGPEARSRDILVEADLAEETLASVDPGQIHQVVLNLLTNAIHALEREGTLRVSVRRETAEVVISVADDGVGIAEEHLGRIFEPFFTHGVGDRQGTGLGLSVSYSIVKAHEGRIAVESRPGEGARFCVTLPVGEEE